MTGMSPEQRRALIFFAWSITLSITLTIIDLAGVHNVILRVAAVFSLLCGVVVLFIRGRAPKE